MEFDILDGLDDLGFSNILKDDDDIKEAIGKGTKSVEFTQLVAWLSKELQALNDMEACINAITDPEDSSSFLMEVSSFLKELHCPYESLMNGPISQRLLDIQSRRTLLELLAARLLFAKKKKTKNVLEIEMDESSTAKSLQTAMKALNIDVEDVALNPTICFTEIENKVKAIFDTNSKEIPPPIITETLSEEQWKSLDVLYDDFFSDYTVRRKLLLTRLDVTVQSFTWGEGNKGKEKKILDVYLALSKKIRTKPSIKLSDIIASRENLLTIEKTSSASLVKNTKSSVNRVLIPAVPDRGGRPKEQRPPVEMPNWMKRTQRGGRGDHGSGNYRGKGKKFRGNKGSGGGNFDASGSY